MDRMAGRAAPCYGSGPMLHGQAINVASAGPIDMSKLPAWRLARHAYLDVLANVRG